MKSFITTICVYIENVIRPFDILQNNSYERIFIECFFFNSLDKASNICWPCSSSIIYYFKKKYSSFASNSMNIDSYAF